MKIGIYTLDSEGQVPDFVVDGGYLPVFNGGESPSDFDLVGLLRNDASGTTFSSWDNLLAYATEQFGATILNSDGVEEPVNTLLGFAIRMIDLGEWVVSES